MLWSHFLDELHDEVFFVTHVRAGSDGLLNLGDYGLVSTVLVVVLLDKRQDIRNIDLYLLDQLHFEDQIILDIIFLFFTAWAQFFVNVVIPRQVVLGIELRDNALLGRELIERRQEVGEFQNSTEYANKLLLLFFVVVGWIHRELILFKQLLYYLLVAQYMLVVLIIKAIIVVSKWTHKDSAACVLVSEEGERLLCSFFQVSEAYHVATVLDTVQYAVGTAVCLQQTMHLQVLIHPEGVECLGIKTCKEHIDYDKYIYFLVLHAKRQVFIVVLELLARRIILGTKHVVIVLDGSIQEVF